MDPKILSTLDPASTVAGRHVCGFLARTRAKQFARSIGDIKSFVFNILCRGPGSNRRPLPLQGNALPTELPRRLLCSELHRSFLLRRRLRRTSRRFISCLHSEASCEVVPTGALVQCYAKVGLPRRLRLLLFDFRRRSKDIFCPFQFLL